MGLTVAVVTRDRYKTWEMKAIARAAARSGCSLALIDPLGCGVDLETGALLSGDGEPLTVDVALGRVDAGCLGAGIRLLALVEGAGVATMNGWRAFRLGRDKAFTSAALIGAALPHPPTWVLTPAAAARRAKKFPYPLVQKERVGSRGGGIRLIERPSDLVALARKAAGPLYLQAFRPGRDLRVMLLDGAVLGAVRRLPPPGEWRANAALGARTIPASLDEASRTLALQAAAAVDARFAGVDLIETGEGPLVLEVNVCPSFRAFSEATGVDVAGALVSSLRRLGANDRRERA